MSKEETFRTWLKKNYGIQDYEAYRNTQTEELAIQYAMHFADQQVREYKDKLKKASLGKYGQGSFTKSLEILIDSE